MSVLLIHERFEVANSTHRNLPIDGDRSSVRAHPRLPGLHDAPLNVFPAELPVPERGRILLVDDNDSVRETLADLLETEGFATVQASDAAQAITLMRREPAFHALVTDLSMPGADGITLIHEARQLQSAIPAILLTGYAEQVATVAVGTDGNFLVLRKPVEGDRLVNEITTLMQSPPKA